MNVDFRCEHCGKLLSAPAHANEPVRCPHCQKLTAVPAGLAALPRPKIEGAGAPPPVPAPAAGAPAGAAAPGAQQEEEQAPAQSGEFLVVMERMMPFVISLFFHVGLLLVTVFLGTMLVERKEVPREITVAESGIPNIDGDDDPGGTLTPSDRPIAENSGGGSRFTKVTESSAKSTIIASSGGGSGDARPGSAMIGVGGATGGTGTGTGTGTGKGWFSGGGGGGSFFGMGPGRGGGGGLARHIVYVVDRSGSMMPTFDALRDEMLSSIGRLDGAKQDFHVIFFSEGTPVEPVDKRLVPATAEYKAKATDGLNTVYAKGQTDPVPALTKAFDVLDKAETSGKVIFLLTDAEFPDNDKVAQLIKARNAKKDVHIFTYLYGERPKAKTEWATEEFMKKLAADNGGRYKFVSPE